jgi:glycosyltransferase involved in cell wall biosynthesis
MDGDQDHSTVTECAGTSHATNDRAPTVLQVLPALVTGGVERGTVDIAEAVVQAGGRAIVVSAGGPMVTELTRAKAEHVTLPVDSKNPMVIYQNIRRLADLIAAENVDIVHARSRAPAWSAWRAAKATRRPFVTTFHGTYGHGNAVKRWYNSVMVRGERVIAISDFIAGHIRQLYGVPTNRIRVIPRGVDMARFDFDAVRRERVIDLAQRWRLPDGMPVVMLPGRLTRWKGQAVFIDAVERFVKQTGRRDIQCLLVGADQGRAGYRRELETEIEERDLGSIIHVIDDCNDMPAAYMLTDVVVSASTDPEAFGRVIVEAQALGRPVIATDHGGARETVLEGVTGWLVPPGDAEALARAIQLALSIDGEERRRLSARAVANIRANYTKALMCERTLAVYDEILREHAPGR